MTLPDQLTAAEFERLKAQEQRMLNSGSWVPQAENVHAARLNESAARESMPDMMSAEQADVAAAEQSVMAETPFGRSVGAEPDYSSTPAVNPADSEPKTIDELRRRQKEVYHDPTYDMPFDEWREYTNWERENSGAVEGFLGGLSGAPQALGQLGFNLVKERGQQYLRVMGGDPIGALDTEVATFKEMGRKVGVGLTQFVDWVGGKVNDMVTSGRRVGQKQAQIVAALREDGKLTGDPMQDNDTIRMAMEEAAAQGMFDESQNERTDDEQTKYERYLRQKQYDRDYAGIFEYSLGGNRVTLPGVKQSFANPITGNVAQPQEATATVGAMVFDPVNAVPIGAGALSKVRMLRRLASVTGTPLKYAEQLGATADSWLMRQGDRITSKIPLVGDLPLGQRAAVLAGAAGVGAYVDSKTDGGLSLVTTPLMVAGGILPVMKASGTVLRKTGAVGGAGWQIVKEMDAGGIGAARAATAERMASSGAFGQFSQYMRPGASGVESSLRRVSMNPDAPETLRRVARSADNIGITQVARAADDLVSSSLVAGATAVPFALVAPDEQTAGQIVGGAMTLGGALGTAGRFLGRRSARADADISRMLVDVEMAGGDAKSLLSLDYASLDWLAAQQGLTQGKVDVIPLRAQEYRANVDIKNSGAETVAGLHLDRTVDGRAKIYVNMGHTAPIAGRVSVKDVQITRNGKTEKASVVRIKGEDGKSDFTVVPKEYPLLVKSGDVVGENTHLARGLSPRRIMPHEIGHAILTSNILDGAIRDDMRNLVNQQYGADGIEARGREYVTRLVDRDIMAGAHDALPDKLTQQEFDDIAAGKVTMADVVKGKPLNDAERTRLINERMEEMRDQSRAAGNNPDGLDVFRDEVVAETFSSLSESIDFRKMRTGGPRVMESIYNGMTRVFETLGLNFDQSTGKLLDNPSVIFRDNPLTKDPVMRKRLQEHLRNYEALMVNMEQAGQRKQRGTPVSSDGTAESARRSTHTKLRPNDNGILENDIIFIDQNGNAQWKPQNMLDEQERGRASQVMFLYDKDKILPANSKEFGRRRAADGRILISGPTLPAKFDALRWFPRWLRPNKSTSDIGLARTLEASRDEGMSYIFDVNVIGSGESGRYRVKNRGDIRAVIREGVFIGWQATKNHHLNAVVLDLNAFRSSAMKAINDGKLGVFNNDMTQLQADLMQYMSNHKNGLPGEAGIGIEKRDLLNGLIGTGTAVQRAANPLYSDLNPRGSIRTFRVDRLNDAQPTGRTGYHIDYDKINNNRMPSALPQSGMAMPEVAPSGRGQAMPDVDADYIDAVQKGDTETAQRLVDEAATFEATSPKLWLSREFEQPSLDKVKRAARKLPSASDPVAALIDVYGGGVERYRQGWIVKHQSGSTAFYNDKAGRTQSMNITDSTRIKPDWLVIHRTEGEYLDPTLFQTGRPTLIFARHFTNKAAEQSILGKGKLKKMGSTFHNDNEALGMFAIGYDDPSWAPGLEDYGGQSVTGWVRMENPMVLHSTDITELPARRVEELMIRMREKGHDGIIYQRDPMPSERAVEFLTPSKAAEMPDIQSKVDSAIREAAEFYRDAIARATEQDRSAWALGGLEAIIRREKIPPAGKGEARSVATAARAVRSWVLKTTDAGKRILKAEHDRVAKAAERVASSPDEGVFRMPWVVIPWDKVNTSWKLADPITKDGSGNIIPPSKRFDRSRPDVRYGIAGAALAAGAMASQEEQ